MIKIDEVLLLMKTLLNFIKKCKKTIIFQGNPFDIIILKKSLQKCKPSCVDNGRDT